MHKILLCVRKFRQNEYGLVENDSILSFFVYVSHEGSRSISFIWKMQNKIPAKFIEITSKLTIHKNTSKIDSVLIYY